MNTLMTDIDSLAVSRVLQFHNRNATNLAVDTRRLDRGASAVSCATASNIKNS